MRLTERGRDYLLGLALLETVGLATGANLFAALALALAFASLISMALLTLRAPESLGVSTSENHIRLYKNQEGGLALLLHGKRARWTSPEVESVAVDGAVETRVVKDGEQYFVKVRPMKAGRFSGFRVDAMLCDALGLFSMRRQVALEHIVIDSLPISMLSRTGLVSLLPVNMGESPAGYPGKGQEFYGIEAYTEQSESRDILWKRAASSPHSPLLARVREANSPESIRITVAYGEVSEEMRGDFTDLQCEALGSLGTTLLANRVEVVIIGPDGISQAARDDEELAEAIMETAGASKGTPRREMPASGLGIIMAIGDLPESSLAFMGRSPVVFVGTGRRHMGDRYSIDFTGVEDLSRILGLVLAG
jgi:uncharacterized protein (DUF58 family)